jgi:hypothetical protein
MQGHTCVNINIHKNTAVYLMFVLIGTGTISTCTASAQMDSNH